ADCDVRMIVGIELSYLDLAGELLGDAFDRGRELAAGTAPGRPEIDQHGLLALHYLLLPVGRAKLRYMLTGHDLPPFLRASHRKIEPQSKNRLLREDIIEVAFSRCNETV